MLLNPAQITLNGLLEAMKLLTLVIITDGDTHFTLQHSFSYFNFLDKIQVKWPMTIPTLNLQVFLNS